eukprot:526451_1
MHASIFTSLYICIISTLSLTINLLNTPHLTWKITDSSLINDILTAKNTHSFESPVFELNHFKWFMRISPNGRTDKEYGRFILALVLATLPNHISNITCQPTFQIIETKTLYPFTKIASYQQSSSYRWGSHTLNLSSNTIKTIQKLSKITIHISTNIITAYDNNHNVVPISYNQIVAIIPKSTMEFSYVWNLYNDLRNIKRAKTSHKSIWVSPTFGGDLFEWNIQFYPNGYPKRDSKVLLFIRFKCLNDEIGYIFIKYKLWFIEANIKFTYQRKISNPMKSFGWYEDTMRHDELLNVKNITILCDIDVIDIYDKQNNIVTDYYAYIQDDLYDKNNEYVVDDYGRIVMVIPKDNDVEPMHVYNKHNVTEKVPLDSHYNHTKQKNVTINERMIVNKTDIYSKQEVEDVHGNKDGKNMNNNGTLGNDRYQMDMEHVSMCDDINGNCNDNGKFEHGNFSNAERDEFENVILDNLIVGKEPSVILKFMLVIYCSGFHCSMFAIYQQVIKPSVSVHCVLAFLYYFCIFFMDSLFDL